MNLRTTASFATKEILRQFGNTENFLFGLLQPLRRDIVLPTAGGTPVVAAMHLVKQSIRQDTIKSPVFPIPIAALSVYLPTGSAGITRPLHGVLPPTCCAVRRSPSRDRSDTLSKRHLFYTDRVSPHNARSPRDPRQPSALYSKTRTLSAESAASPSYSTDRNTCTDNIRPSCPWCSPLTS